MLESDLVYAIAISPLLIILIGQNKSCVDWSHQGLTLVSFVAIMASIFGAPSCPKLFLLTALMLAFQLNCRCPVDVVQDTRVAQMVRFS